METTSAQAPERGLNWVTPAVLLAVAGIGILFAFEATDASSTWFGIFKIVHVGFAVFWVGGQSGPRIRRISRPSPGRRRSSARSCSRPPAASSS